MSNSSGQTCFNIYCVKFELDCEKKTGFKINVRNVRCILNCEHLQRQKFQQKSWLKQEYKLCCLQSTERHVCANKKWQRVVFIDEKSYDLDGFDGLHYYYHNLRKEQQLFSRRPIEGSGTMIQGDVGCQGKMEIKFITGKLNSRKYMETINE